MKAIFQWALAVCAVGSAVAAAVIAFIPGAWFFALCWTLIAATFGAQSVSMSEIRKTDQIIHEMGVRTQRMMDRRAEKRS